jgi:elongation factor Ts
MKVDMQVLKQLRDATLASLKDCREALIEANGDLDKAHEILKKSGAMKAAKKADRETNEGIVKFLSKDGKHVGIKLLCETDFVAKNDTFQELVDGILNNLMVVNANISSLDQLDASIAESLHALVADAIAKIGENLRLVDVYISDENAYVYNHP